MKQPAVIALLLFSQTAFAQEAAVSSAAGGPLEISSLLSECAKINGEIASDPTKLFEKTEKRAAEMGIVDIQQRIRFAEVCIAYTVGVSQGQGPGQKP